MSNQGHSGAGLSDEGQPNLVPLLDLVMQLIMFFMMCANFVMEQVDQTVMLPVAQMAKPISETGSDVVFLNINDQGQLLAVGKPEPIQADNEVADYLQSIVNDSRKRMGSLEGPVDTLVIVRAHKDAAYAGIY